MALNPKAAENTLAAEIAAQIRVEVTSAVYARFPQLTPAEKLAFGETLVLRVAETQARRICEKAKAGIRESQPQLSSAELHERAQHLILKMTATMAQGVRELRAARPGAVLTNTKIMAGIPWDDVADIVDEVVSMRGPEPTIEQTARKGAGTIVMTADDLARVIQAAKLEPTETTTELEVERGDGTIDTTRIRKRRVAKND